MTSGGTTVRPTNGEKLNVDGAVRDRYSRAAQQQEPQLCCAVDYDPRFLDVIPREIIERDYGCGDPSQHLAAGETVLDLGSGGGKICYIAAQIVGPKGRVIGVDCNETMLSLAREHRQQVGDRIGYHNVEFRKGRIQDLQLDLELLEEHLQAHPTTTSSDWLGAQEHAQHLRETRPLVADDSVDVVVSNCVLNLVRSDDRRQLFSEIYRVLNRGGRAVISDIVSDEEVPQHLQHDPRLWSGCISGAFREDAFLQAFEDAGFYGIEVLSRQAEPWAIVEGIEFRSVTVRAYKGKDGPCLERNQAVMYGGPWKAVIDDDGHKLVRGQRMAVCDKTFQIYSRAPYADDITPIPPQVETPLAEAAPFPCNGVAFRPPAESKGDRRPQTKLPEGDCCGPNGCC